MFAKCWSRKSLSFSTKRNQHNLILFGSDQYSLSHIEAIREREQHQADVKIHHVVTGSERTPVAGFCQEFALPFSIWPRTISAPPQTLLQCIQCTEQLCSNLLGLVISFGRFLPTELIAAFPRGCLNIHPSLLPRWRGACPILHTLLVGDYWTGISIVQLPTYDHRFDSGPVIYQRPIAIPPWIRRLDELQHFLTDYSIESMFEVLHRHSSYCLSPRIDRTLLLGPLNASRPTRPMGFLDWNRQSAYEVVRLWEALQHSRSIYLSTSLLTSSGTASVRLSHRQPPIDVESSVLGRNFADDDNEMLQQDIGGAKTLLFHHLPHGLPSGRLVYLRRQHPTNHQLIPLAFVACRSANDSSSASTSWLAVSEFVVDWPGSKSAKRMTALALYNGYLSHRPDLVAPDQSAVIGLTTNGILNSSLSAPLPLIVNVFTGFQSQANPYWPLPEPLKSLSQPLSEIALQ